MHDLEAAYEGLPHLGEHDTVAHAEIAMHKDKGNKSSQTIDARRLVFFGFPPHLVSAPHCLSLGFRLRSREPLTTHHFPHPWLSAWPNYRLSRTRSQNHQLHLLLAAVGVEKVTSPPLPRPLDSPSCCQPATPL